MNLIILSSPAKKFLKAFGDTVGILIVGFLSGAAWIKVLLQKEEIFVRELEYILQEHTLEGIVIVSYSISSLFFIVSLLFFITIYVLIFVFELFYPNTRV